MSEARPSAPAPALPADEAERLRALRELGLLDTPVEERFRPPYPPGQPGLTNREHDRDGSFCAATILGDDVLVLLDTAADARFARKRLVTDVGLRFYAGRPLRDAGDRKLGTFCLMDTKRPPVQRL